MDKILIIGACGQLGVELTLFLREIFGNTNVVATDISNPPDELKEGPFETMDVLNAQALYNLINKHKINQVYNLAALLSASGEKNPKFAWKLNMEGLINVLDAAKDLKLSKIYWPSSIAVFGPGTPTENTPQKTIMDPNTVYGISKLAGERWCSYYYHKHGVDVRSIRYPGLIGYKSLPGGGTTDYAVDIFHKAVAGIPYNCFLKPDTFLPMMYMPDAIAATVDLMQAEENKISIRESYNVAGFSCSPQELAKELQLHIPEFSINYTPDYRQEIADSWPDSIDDSVAQNDWGWHKKYDLKKMTSDMLTHLNTKNKSSV